MTAFSTDHLELIAAILTMRIRSLSSHLIALPRDIQNRQALRLMISRRARLLKYLRKVSVTRYEDVLDKIGVEPRAVEGEVVITKEDLRTMIRGQ
jgi:small subunit ribosomal protein S15